MIVSPDDMGIAYKDTYTTDIAIQKISLGNEIVPVYGVKLINASKNLNIPNI